MINLSAPYDFTNDFIFNVFLLELYFSMHYMTLFSRNLMYMYFTVASSRSSQYLGLADLLVLSKNVFHSLHSHRVNWDYSFIMVKKIIKNVNNRSVITISHKVNIYLGFL